MFLDVAVAQEAGKGQNWGWNDQMQLELQAFGPRGSEAEFTGPVCEVRPVSALVLPEEETGFYLPLILR